MKPILTLLLMLLALPGWAQKGYIYGVVRDSATGKPVPDASITIYQGGSYYAGTNYPDSMGRFISWQLPAHVYRVEVRARHYYTKQLPRVIVEPGGRTRLEVNLGQMPRGTIAGRVIDATTGEPIRKAPFYLFPHKEPLHTDSLGAFSTELLPLSQYRIQIKWPGYDSLHLEGIRVSDGKVTQVTIGLEKIPVPEGKDLAGRTYVYGVVIDRYHPQPYWKWSFPVHFLNNGQIIATTKTNSYGEFSLSQLPPGRYQVELGGSWAKYQLNNFEVDVAVGKPSEMRIEHNAVITKTTSCPAAWLRPRLAARLKRRSQRAFQKLMANPETALQPGSAPAETTANHLHLPPIKCEIPDIAPLTGACFQPASYLSITKIVQAPHAGPHPALNLAKQARHPVKRGFQPQPPCHEGRA